MAATPSIDPVLLEILSREVAVHLGTIREFVAKAGEATSQPLPERIFRACHTLHGSLTMAGVSAAVEVTALLNDLMGVLYTARIPADAAVIAAAGETAGVVARIVGQLSETASAPSPFRRPRAGRTRPLIAGTQPSCLKQAGERAAALSDDSADSGTMSVLLPALSEEDAGRLPWMSSSKHRRGRHPRRKGSFRTSCRSLART